MLNQDDHADSPGPGPLSEPAARRRLGQHLRHVIADAFGSVGRLRRHLVGGDASRLEVFALTRALARADHLVDCLLRDPDDPSIGQHVLDLNAFLSERAQGLRLSVGAGVSFTLRPLAGGVAVLATPEELEMILYGLVEGANEAMPAGGDLTIGTGWLDCVPPGISVDVLWPRRHVRLTVSDTGTGGDQETWRRVVTPLDPSTDVTDSIASVVRRLHGYLLMESTDGEGSRIHVCLPALGHDDGRSDRAPGGHGRTDS